MIASPGSVQGAIVFVALLGIGCENNARDAHCTPDSPNRDADPGCIYAGKGQGPPFVEPPCTEDGAGGAPASCPSFYDVLDVLTDPAKGNCSSLGCHGASETNAASGIFLPGTPQAFYDGLLEATGTVGRPYVVADDPATGDNEALESWMGCNLRGERGGGYPMPLPVGMPDQADVDVVSDWLRCGATAPEACPAVAADGACAACAKEKCCNRVVQCLADTACALCAACLQAGDPSTCTAECDPQNPQVAKLYSCASGLCMTECPGAAQ